MRKLLFAIFAIMFILSVGVVLAIPFNPKADVDLQNRYRLFNGVLENVTLSTPPTECLLTNTFATYSDLNYTLCRGINESALNVSRFSTDSRYALSGSGGGSSYSRSVYVNNTWIGAAATASALSAASVAADTVRVYPLVLKSNVTVNAIGWIHNSTNKGNCTLGVYNSTTLGYPDILLIDTGNIAMVTTGSKSVDITPIELLKDQLYWTAYACTTASATVRMYQVSGEPPWLGHDLTDSNNWNTGMSLTLTYNQSDGLKSTFPAGATFLTNAVAPFIGLRVVS